MDDLFHARELRLLCSAAGLVVDHIWSVDPGAYRAAPPDLDHAEFLVVATKPGGADPEARRPDQHGASCGEAAPLSRKTGQPLR
ncbi:MAG: hypothetical protein WKF43_15535 [Acidimicrobiales bacterium]